MLGWGKDHKTCLFPQPVSRHALTAAKKLGGDVSCIVVGPKCAGPAKEAAQVGAVLFRIN